MTSTSLPIHFTQKNRVAELPNTMKTDSSGAASTTALRTAHLLINMPKGARNMPAMPMSIMTATRGMRRIRPDMSSMLRLCSLCSTAPTHRNNRHLDTAWKMISSTPAHIAS